MSKPITATFAAGWPFAAFMLAYTVASATAGIRIGGWLGWSLVAFAVIANVGAVAQVGNRTNLLKIAALASSEPISDVTKLEISYSNEDGACIALAGTKPVRFDLPSERARPTPAP